MVITNDETGGSVDGGRVLRLRVIRRGMADWLGGWALGSVVLGVVLWFGVGGAFVGAIGSQFAIWGAIDLVFAVMGWRQSWKVAGALPAAEELVEGVKLGDFLQFNHWLNVAYVAVGCGLGLMAVFASGDGRLALAGHGAGVLVQGGYLLWLDRRNEARLRAVIAG
jgi:hypothetical protein